MFKPRWQQSSKQVVYRHGTSVLLAQSKRPGVQASFLECLNCAVDEIAS